VAQCLRETDEHPIYAPESHGTLYIHVYPYKSLEDVRIWT